MDPPLALFSSSLSSSPHFLLIPGPSKFMAGQLGHDQLTSGM